MSETLFNQLRNIGIAEELVHEVDKVLSPEHVATKQDLLVMQETILQTQLKSEGRYQELRSDIMRLDCKIDRVSSDLRVEVAAISCQFWITFGRLITTILSVFAVNWYFH